MRQRHQEAAERLLRVLPTAGYRAAAACRIPCRLKLAWVQVAREATGPADYDAAGFNGRSLGLDFVVYRVFGSRASAPAKRHTLPRANIWWPQQLVVLDGELE